MCGKIGFIDSITIYIYIYIYMSGGKSWLVAPGVAVLP